MVSLQPLAAVAAGASDALQLQGGHNAPVSCLMQHRWQQAHASQPLKDVLVSGTRSCQLGFLLPPCAAYGLNC